MKIQSFAVLIVLLFNSLISGANEPKKKTDSNIFGDVQSNGEHIPFVSIYIKGTSIGTTTDASGHYTMINLPVGKHTLVAKTLGYKPAERTVTVALGQSQEINFMLEEEHMALNQVVVTGTKTFKRQTESPVIVNVLGSEALNLVQA